MQITNQKKKKKIQTIGSFSYSDPAGGLSLSANKVAGLTFNGNQAHFTGTAKIGKRKASFSVDATDNGQPGTPNDIFSISISNGYSASGHLTSGDILFQQ